MFSKGTNNLATGDMPNSDRSIFLGAGQIGAIGTDCYGKNCIRVTREGFGASAGLDIPNLCTMVFGSTGNLMTLGMEGQGPESGVMAKEGFETFASSDIP
jgi:hypothetical protein